ncbi:hypothetical protein ACTJKQ_12675 [Acidovorax sp. 22279]|uniref:hypothetical protein n=1 Tax=Acidovorax sp. 22279 TaxID=3453900 RepID=UPI003F84BA7C
MNFNKQIELRCIEAEMPDLNDSELRARLEEFLKGYSVKGIELPSGTFVYRARCLGAGFEKAHANNISQFHMPPANYASRQRLNAAGAPVFYCSTAWEPLPYEVRATTGMNLIISSWKLSRSAMVVALGYSKASLTMLGAEREFPEWGVSPGFSSTSKRPAGEEDFLAELLMRPVNDDDLSHYRLTSALAGILLGKVRGEDRVLAGLVYPSVSMSGNGDNIAFAPWFANDHLICLGSQEHAIVDRNGMEIETKCVDRSILIGEDGSVSWSGTGGFTIPGGGSVICTAKSGLASDGFYMRLGDGTRGHWEIKNDADGSVIATLA